MRRLVLIPLIAALPLMAQAQDVCPETPDHTAREDAIFAEIAKAQDETTAQILSGGLWQLWTDAPDAHAQALLDEGMSQRESYNLLGARQTLNRLIAYCPDYAEGYNQRAFASFLSQNYADAAPDLERALDLNPRHLGAMTGLVMTYMALEQFDRALPLLKDALALNPWLRERGLLPMLEPPGEKL